ncbi:asparagine synthase (glutamine-hydrolysing) [Pricia antarctica]|uniref:asparagine synthase (glutamine-hydrolyzing) n=1 Tax=Pricia antarctica TaxID=641691 RepID=A0A1G6X222_9FLAO|nr:asparagine synthase (glutamine-hydrolyzing) [Pricia antarctica]SDD72109.1 asparagine synthase (glutamine-hydrolysing) [Pricia antarctica]
MCGIAGIYSKKTIDDLQARIVKMTESIVHRGPDSGAFYISQNKVALGHRRLSIIDLRNVANQPMTSSDGHWQVVFNGEIYNFNEIKKEITYDFITDSDTEVILAAVQNYGVDWFLERANGMFSMALYNVETEVLFLIRDRLGIKPLYYYNDGVNLVFASEIKAILNSGLVEAKFNTLAVDEYLANRYIRAPYTFFEGIWQLQPGTFHRYTNDLTFTEKSYWELPNAFNVSTEFDEQQIKIEFEAELKKAIEYRLIADVPLGTYLSGGVDSSLITAITALKKKGEVNTYTIGFEEMNEFKYARTVAEKYDTAHHEILMKKEDYLANWERLIAAKDSPLGVPNEIPLAIMSSKLKEKITVVLSGEGADELMGGYGRIFRLPFDFVNHPTGESFYDHFIANYEYVPRAMRDELINTPTDYRKEFDTMIQQQFVEHDNEENIFRFFHQYHVKGLLQRVDMTTMQTSVEARVPFLDHNLIEFAYKKIPYGLKLKWLDDKSKQMAKNQTAEVYSEVLDVPKYLLREVSYKYLPEEIITRKKVGFPVPLTEWFENLEELANKLLVNCSWLKDGVLPELISKSKTESRAGQILWMFVNIELFKKQYFTTEWRW